MLRGIYKYGLALCLCLTVSLLWAQKKTDRDYLRSGNRLYRDSMYTKAVKPLKPTVVSLRHISIWEMRC